jgi:hypothetical protein
MHPNIPSQKERQLIVVLRRAGIVGFTLIAPEMTILWAMRQWVVARKLAMKYRGTKPVVQHFWCIFVHLGSLEYDWTRTHGFFAIMGGFILFDEEEPLGILPPHHLKDYLRKRQIRITRKEIDDKSRRDWVSKGLVLVQTTWFLLQCVARAIRRMPVTELEVITVAFAVLNFVTNWFWWNKPQDVGCPILVLKTSAEDERPPFPLDVQHPGVPPDVASVEASPQASPDYLVSAPTQAHSRDSSTSTSQPVSCNQLSTQSQTPGTAFYSPALEQRCPCHAGFPCPTTSAKPPDPLGSQFRSNERGGENGMHEDGLPVVLDAVRDMIKQKLEDIKACGVWGTRLHRILSAAFSPLLLMTDISAKIVGRQAIETSALRVPTFYGGDWSVDEQLLIGVGASLVAVVFGGIHCIAWSFQFPTRIEKILWRSSAIVITCTPAFFSTHRLMVWLAYRKGRKQSPPLFGWESTLAGVWLTFIMILYLFARLILLTLAIITLRALPLGAYQTVSWTQFIPHI